MSNDCPNYYNIDDFGPIEAELGPVQPGFGPVVYVIAFNARGEAELIVRRDFKVHEEEPHPAEWARYKEIAGEVVPSHGMAPAQTGEQADRYTYIRVDNLGSHHVGCGKNSGGRICCNIVDC
jgi:hypothetical protein